MFLQLGLELGPLVGQDWFICDEAIVGLTSPFSPPGETGWCKQSTLAALKAGYRHLDCAWNYGV